MLTPMPFCPDLVDLYYGIHEAECPVLVVPVPRIMGAWYLLPTVSAAQSGALESIDVLKEFAPDDKWYFWIGKHRSQVERPLYMAGGRLWNQAFRQLPCLPFDSRRPFPVRALGDRLA